VVGLEHAAVRRRVQLLHEPLDCGRRLVAVVVAGRGVLLSTRRPGGAEHLGVALEGVLEARHADHAVRAEAGGLLGADVHVVGDSQVVEPTRGRHRELLLDPEAERVGVLGPGVVVAWPAIGVV
jgi:hypothetical protein